MESELKRKNISKDNKDLNILEIAKGSESFLEFITNTNERDLNSFLETYYYGLKIICENKGVNKGCAHLGENCGIEFCGAIFLELYEKIRFNKVAIESCNNVLMGAINGMPPEEFSDYMDRVIIETSNVPYIEWDAACRYLKSHHGKWIRRYEFTKNNTLEDYIRYDKFLKYME